jgi:hypothetical protein
VGVATVTDRYHVEQQWLGHYWIGPWAAVEKSSGSGNWPFRAQALGASAAFTRLGFI